jgi:hypothetical protein
VRSIRVLAAVAVASVAALTAACAKTDTPGSAAPASRSESPSLTDNGVAKLTANQILDKATAAFRRAGSVHIKGSGFADGEQFSMDLRLKGSAGGYGTLTSNGQTLEVIRIGKTAYLKADKGFWENQVNAQVAKLLDGKYVKGPTTHPSLKPLASLTDLTDAARELLKPDGAIRKGSRQKIDGVNAIGLVDASADGGTLYIALQGEPYPLRVVPNTKSRDDQGALEFLEYGEPVTLTAPPDAQTIDSSRLSGG